MTWACNECDENIEDQFTECWNCGTSRDGSAPEEEELFVNADVRLSQTGLASARAISADDDSDVLADEQQDFPTRKPTLGKPAAQRRLSARAANRYDDAYLVARAINAWGGAIKVLGLIVALVIFGAITVLGRALADGHSTVVAFIGFVCGGVIATALYAIGVIVSAQGQILKASLDAAVHSSPFLSNAQRVQIMSL